MNINFKGNDGDYVVKNESTILQYKIDENGEQTGESIRHIIVDSIENNEDRNEIFKKLEARNIT
jgi:hypothetical protein